MNNKASTDAAFLLLESAARIWQGLKPEQARQVLRAAGISEQFANMDIRLMPSGVQQRVICGIELADLMLLPQQHLVSSVNVTQMHLATGRFARITSNRRDMSVLLAPHMSASDSLLQTAAEWRAKASRLAAMAEECVQAALALSNGQANVESGCLRTGLIAGAEHQG